MDFRRVRRLSWVLVASELRSGRSSANPKSLFGQPIFLLVVDAFVGGAVAIVGSLFFRAIAPTDHSIVPLAVHQGLPVLPLFCLGGVVIAGVLFELNRSARFATSDAANWLPITPREYVLASASAIAYSDSLIVALAGGIAFAIGGASGQWGAVLLTLALSANALLGGALLVEMVRATTQRASAALSGRSGRAAVAGRLALFVLAILVFDLLFNPILLVQALGALSGLGAVAYAVPVLWGSLAIESFSAGGILASAGATALALALTAGFVYTAATLRVRFWAPVPAELRFDDHVYSESHPVLHRLGLNRIEATIVAKDLRGLVRRREMLPIVALPLVLVVAVTITSVASGGGGSGPSFISGYAGWVCGFGALLLATTSFGQERRSVVTLYQVPVAPSSIYRAKRAVPVMFGMLYAGVLTVLIAIIARPVSPIFIVGEFAAYVSVGYLSALLGLAFAARFSDFQERPRPQFIRPWAMIVALAVALPIDLGILGVAGIVLGSIAAGTGPLLPLAVGLVVFVLAAAIAFGALARSGTMRLLRELPV